MLRALKLNSADELFADIPASVRKAGTTLKDHISEYELMKEAEGIASLNEFNNFSNFLGCGTYDRIVPSSVDFVISRTEFLTSYTPYQAEISQGVLQSLFEYQSVISDLMEMDVTNSSMYDGFSALAESVRMAYRVNGRKKILYPENLYTRKLKVIRNYVSGLDLKLEPYTMDMETGFMDLESIQGKVDADTCAVIVENPNSYGILDENITHVKEAVGDALLISYVDPISLGVIAPPGSYGADIAVAEGQQLGLHQNFGGPFLGILSFSSDLVRRSPGRIIGKSTDSHGKDAYVMTLQTREQHIRREKATSNICTNQALMAIASLAYLSVTGSKGLSDVALMTLERSRKLRKILSGIDGINADLFSGTSFSDVLVNIPSDPSELQKHLYNNRIFGGIPLNSLIEKTPDKLAKSYFFSVTEKTEDSDLNKLEKALTEVL